MQEVAKRSPVDCIYNHHNIFHFRILKKNRKQKMNSNMCELSYKSEKLLLTTDCINIDHLQCLFSIKREGLHIKVKIEDIWKNIYPNATSNFEMPRSVNFAYAVSFSKTILSEEA